MSHTIDFDTLQGSLLGALLDGADAQGIVDSAHRVLQLPLIAFDVQFRPLAFAFQRPCYYEAWEGIVKGEGSERFMVYLPNQERIFQHGRSLLFDQQPIVEVACAIKADGRLVGYVGMIIEDADTDQVLQANDLLADVLAYYYTTALPQRAHQVEDLDDASLLSLLFSNAPSSSLLDQVSRLCRPSYLFVAVESDQGSIPDLHFICRTYCKKENQVLGVVGNNGTLHMFCWGQRSTDLTWLAVALENIGSTMLVRCGVSDYFHNLTDLATHRQQAIALIHAGLRCRPDEYVYLFADSITSLVYTAAVDRLGPDVLIPAELVTLVDAQADGKPYLETLDAFLRSHGGITKAAKSLGIHNNTLKHRMEKIEALLQVDLKDSAVQFRLGVGLEMLRLHRGDQTWR